MTAEVASAGRPAGTVFSGWAGSFSSAPDAGSTFVLSRFCSFMVLPPQVTGSAEARKGGSKSNAGRRQSSGSGQGLPPGEGGVLQPARHRGLLGGAVCRLL